MWKLENGDSFPLPEMQVDYYRTTRRHILENSTPDVSLRQLFRHYGLLKEEYSVKRMSFFHKRGQNCIPMLRILCFQGLFCACGSFILPRLQYIDQRTAQPRSSHVSSIS
jgi:hypothetical protein